MLTRIGMTLALLLGSGLLAAAEWPAFRGAAADGALRQTVFEPGEQLGLRVAWKRRLGSGYSSVSVAEGRAVTMFSDGENDQLIALDQASGHEHWRVEVGPTYVGHDGSHTGPMSTPLLSEGRVFALGPRGRLLAVALDSGEPLWSVELTDLGAKKPFYGFSTAPLLIDEVLVVQMGATEDGAIAGLDPKDGSLLWSALADSIDHQSPVPFPVGERTMVLAAGAKKLAALDPRTGDLFWEFSHEGGGARGVQSLMPVLADEGRVFLAHQDHQSKLIQIGHGDEGPTFEPLWMNGAIRNSYNVAVYHGGHLYAFSSRFLTCVDALTGEAAWRSRAPGDGFLILVDGHLVIQTKNGTLHLAEATPDGYRELASTSLFEDLGWSPPSFADGSIFARSLGEVARVDVVQGEATRMADTGAAVLEGTAFGAFLARVAESQDKQAAVDAYLAEQTSFPIVEGNDLVHFVYTGEATDLALAGDLIGSRQEAPMRQVEGTNLFYYSTRLEPDARLAYVFIKDYEETLDPRNPNQHMSTIYGRDMEMIFDPAGAIWMSWMAMPEWEPPTHLEAVATERQGTFETHEIQSEQLDKPVPLAIYLPRGYAEDASRRYPVAYIAGGTVSRQVGQLGATLDSLIDVRIEPLIAVFYDAALPPFQMGKIGDVLAEEVIPYVDANYRTLASREQRASIGAGFPGYGAMFAAFSQADLFGRMGVVSPVMLSSMRVPLEAAMPHAKESPVEMYLSWGKYDMRNPHENWDMTRNMKSFTELLREHGYAPLGGQVNDGAGWSAYRNQTDDLLAALFPIAP